MLAAEAGQIIGNTLHALGVEAVRELRCMLSDRLDDVGEFAGLVGSAVGQRVDLDRQVTQALRGLCGPIVGLGAEVGQCSLRRSRELGSGVVHDRAACVGASSATQVTTAGIPVSASPFGGGPARQGSGLIGRLSTASKSSWSFQSASHT